MNFQDKVSFIWSIAEVLRGEYKPENYGEVILPLVVIRRFDCVLEKTKPEVLEQYKILQNKPEGVQTALLTKTSKEDFYNISNYGFNNLLSDPDNIADNFKDYLNGFSKNANEIIQYFNFDSEIDKLDRNDLLYEVLKRFSEIDLHPNTVSNIEMGYIFEELIRRFSENAEAGDHYTPREVIRLMVHLLFNDDRIDIATEGITKTLYDCAAGTGGMGSVANEYMKSHNNLGELIFHAQEVNEESYAIAKSDLLLKKEDANNIRLGNTLTNDKFKTDTFDFMISNPPYGVDWKKVEKAVKDEHNDLGFNGRFGAGLPRTSDGQLLFLQHLVSKMKPVTEENPYGSRIAIIMNGSPLFTGDAGSGESEIRRYLFENDLVEGLVALPNDLFYNTGISTYIWILTNNKETHRRGKVTLVNAVDFSRKMKKSMGNKRNEISEEQIMDIVSLYNETKQNKKIKIFDNEDFGFHKITVERPLRLNFMLSKERIERVKHEKVFQNLATSNKKGEAKEKQIEEGIALQQRIINTLNTNVSNEIIKNREIFTKKLKEIFKKEGITVTSTVLKAILNGLSEKDETADICMRNKKTVEVDTELRDYESIPLKKDIQKYFEIEVLPHVPDAWIDETATKVGYEIPFTRCFYEYTPIRSSKEILKEIQKLEAEVAEQLKKVFGNG
ncbi:type I restriction-modification system subunit M [Listeria seeligeri]|nr:class I SAM-dependent DNA methyltransferase [Listeria seeligeri]MBC1593574.1 SAM-dependent DNA methyltransferase [Listeria seeligeri]MBC1915961.1 SAM-dependent DNA methyltransferase [Listeria seeligeri]MBC1989260.1 SAM-dependent DNA methyltransferase [Listeria seeligeri]MBC2212853.1 SAM-dependent DNA methyltransferase [Listeria seeligeri]